MLALWPAVLAAPLVRLAPTHWPIVHGAPTNPDSLDVPVVEGDWQVDKPVALGVNPVAVLEGTDGIWWTSGAGGVVALTTEPELKEVARYKRGSMNPKKGGSMFHGSYSFVDDQNRFYAGFRSTLERYSLNKGNATLIRSVKSLPEWEEGDGMVALNLAPGGHLVVATHFGMVYTKKSGESESDADFVASEWFRLDLRQALGEQDLAVSNSVAMSGSAPSVAFIPTALGLAAVNVDGTAPQLQSWWPIKPAAGWYLNRLGPRGTGSSPTTFFLGDRQFVTVTDGLDNPMNLKVAELSGVGKQAEVASIGVEFPNGNSTSEQSVSVLVEGSSALLVVVQNFVGEDYFDLADPDVHGVVPRAALRAENLRFRRNATLRESKQAKAMISAMELGAGSAGVNAYDFSGSDLKVRWANKDVCAMTIIPLQTRGRVWLVGTLREDTWGVIYLLGLDSTTGKVATRAELGRGPAKLYRNPVYAGIGTDGESLVFGTFGGVIRARAKTTIVV